MSTFMAKPAQVQRKWYMIDAAGKPLGRTAVKVADLLRGKGKPEFTPHVDCGDHFLYNEKRVNLSRGHNSESESVSRSVLFDSL